MTFEKWDPPMYISPDRWNSVGSSCPGWKSKFRASPGAFRSRIPPKKPSAGQTEESTEEDRPHQFSLDLIPTRVMDAAHRLVSVGTGADAVKKAPSWMPKVQGRPSFARIPVL